MTTHKEVLELALKCAERCENIDGMYSWCDTITAIKEDLEQPEQEPVAWQVEFLIQGIWSPIGNPQRNKDRAERLADNPSIPKECQRVIELYINPQQRTWVGLTDVEWMNIVNKDQAWFGQRPDEVAHEVAKLVEAKLKEKNA